jgi:anti-sigma factor RsiW
MSTTCLRFAPMLSARPGELPSADEAALHEHLAGCDACQARLADGEVVGGMVAEALLAEAARVDFAPFVDQVMARVEPGGVRGFLRWVRRHKAVAAAVGLAPTLAALGLIVYLSSGDAEPQAGDVEVVAEGRTATILTTQDGPVVLLGDPADSDGI